MAFINHSKYYFLEKKTKSNYVNVLDVSCLTMVSCDVAIRFVIIWHSFHSKYLHTTKEKKIKLCKCVRCVLFDDGIL